MFRYTHSVRPWREIGKTVYYEVYLYYSLHYNRSLAVLSLLESLVYEVVYDIANESTNG